MPYVWEDAEVFLEHGGVKVYHVYKGDFGTERRSYWFGLTPNCSDDGDEDGEFDARELGAYAADRPGWHGSIRELLDDHIVQVIKLAIDSGKLSNKEPYHHFDKGDK